MGKVGIHVGVVDCEVITKVAVAEVMVMSVVTGMAMLALSR